MKFLLEIPLVMSMASWIWGEDPAVTPDLCIELAPTMSSACWSALVVKGIGIAIIVGACMNKAPIILNILKSKSTEGLSRGSIYGEQILYMNAFFYGMLEGHPITAYGETGAMAIQNAVLVLMSWNFASGNGVSFLERGLVAFGALAYLVVVTSFLTKNMYYLLTVSTWPIMLYAKGTQIYTTAQVKHMGSQSIITSSMNVVGGVLRLATTLKEIGFDVTLLAGVFIGLLLNAIPVGQHFYYRKNTEEFLRKLDAKKQA
jgi:mannose-P-dolichol utilization defect 1